MQSSHNGGIEPFYTIKQIADRLNIPYWKLQRAIKRGDIPVYSPFNSRKLGRISEVVAYIEKSKLGGRQ